MRKILFFLIAFSFVGCSKDEFDPLNPKEGQEVELFLDHYDDVNDQKVFLLPGKVPLMRSLDGFKERELGYIYKVKANVWIASQPLMDDGNNSGFSFVEVISKEKYTGNESFEIGLVYPIGFGSGGQLAIKKEGSQFTYREYDLRPIDATVAQALDDFLLMEKAVESHEEYQKYQMFMQRLGLRAVVTHDPDHYGNGYLVHRLIITEERNE